MVRKTTFGAALTLAAITLGVLRAGREPAHEERPRPSVAEAYGRLPLAFERNVGQADRRARFVARTAGRVTLLTDAGAVLASREGGSLRMELVGASRDAGPVALEELPGKINYLVGNAPSRWLTGVPAYARVEYRDVYPGVDLVFRGDGRRLEYDFVVAPGADPAAVRVAFRGAEAVRLDASGDLVVTVDGREEHHRRPSAFQRSGAERIEVESAYALRGHDEIAFLVGAHRRDLPLVIDPVLVFSTFLGGSGEDAATGIAVDAAGNAYVTALATSGFPTTSGAASTVFGGGTYDAVVAKLSPDGSALLYSTYLGGSGDDHPQGIAVDAAGHAYVTGDTVSSNFPVVGAVYPTNRGGNSDAFVTKLSADGASIVYSTYLGGSAGDLGREIAVDSAGCAHVAGYTRSLNFPAVNAFQPAHGAGNYDDDAFVSKLSADGSSLVYSTYLGGTSSDLAYGIAVDGQGNAIVTGETASGATFPTVNALRGTGVGREAFLTKLAPAGTVVYSTFFGGTGTDRGLAVAADSGGNAYLGGVTSSSGLATPGAAQAVNGGDDVMVAKIAPDGSGVVYCTYLGGTSSEFLGDLAVDDLGQVHVAGYTFSTNLPLVNPIQSVNKGSGGSQDAFIARIGPDGTAFEFSTYLGDTGTDAPWGVAVGPGRCTLVAGETTSAAFPLVGALQPARNGPRDAFVLRVSAGPVVTSVAPALGGTAGGTSVLVSGADFEPGATVAFGGSAATTVTVESATSITAVTPAHGPGIVDVAVTNPAGDTAVLARAFSYTDAPPPSPAAFSPSSGPVAGGTVVTVSGSAFQDGATVTFGGAAATSVTFLGATSLRATAPAHAAGPVLVTVTNPDGQGATVAAAFTFVAPPAITSVAPASGPVAGGTVVTVSGGAFQDGATVTFGGAAAASVTFLSATSLQATAPAHAAGPVDVTVTNPDGQSTTSSAAFEFLAEAAPAPDGGGCGCGTGLASDPSWALLLLLLLPARVARSRRPRLR